MTEHNFTLVISGPVPERLDELFEAGCDDATFGEVDGVQFADFDREAISFQNAVSSAVRNIESVLGLRVLHLEPEDLVTAAEIAERLERSRESVRLLISGDRGSGDFPAPVSHLRSRSRLWRWTEVAAWDGSLDPDRASDAAFVGALNAALEWRTQREQLQDSERALVQELVPS